jgi:hypothetical protein
VNGSPIVTPSEPCSPAGAFGMSDSTPNFAACARTASSLSGCMEYVPSTQLGPPKSGSAGLIALPAIAGTVIAKRSTSARSTVTTMALVDPLIFPPSCTSNARRRRLFAGTIR